MQPVPEDSEPSPDDVPTPRDSFRSTATTAQTVISGASKWLKQVGKTAQEAAIAAGHSAQEAAMSVSGAVDQYSTQIGHAIDERASKDLIQACEQRDKHRLQTETAISAERQEQIILQRDELMAQCVTLTGDIQAEIQYATQETPLGRESYGLMMLVNVLVPVFDNGLRPDWKSVLPAVSMLGSSSQWAQNLMMQARSNHPTAFDVIQAADQGWSQLAPPGCMGLADVPLTGLSGTRRVQAWLYSSLNAGTLAARLQSLMLMQDLLHDWYFPWALLRTDNGLHDVLLELVKIESQEGLIQLPLDDLLRPGSRGTSDMTNWTQKMRDRFHDVAGKARAAGNAAFRNTMSVLSPDGQPGPSPSAADGSPGLGAEVGTPHAPFDAYGVDGLTDTDAEEEGGAREDDTAADTGAMKLSHLHVNDTYGLQSPGSTAGAEHAAGGGGGDGAGGFPSGNLLQTDAEAEGEAGGAAASTGAAADGGSPTTPLTVQDDLVRPPDTEAEGGDEDGSGDRADPDDPFSIGP
eukprot:jgi/Ulvmu1/2618/UM014_0069.1